MKSAPLLLGWLDNDGETLVIDGKTYESLPRGAQWVDRTVYLIDGSISDIAKYWGMAGDRVSGPRPPCVSSMDVRCGGGFWSLRSRDSWALPGGDGEDATRTKARAVLQELHDACEAEGLPWRATASGVAKRVGRVSLPWLGAKTSRLGERYIDLAQHAVTPGPMLVARANGGARALQLDRRAAFLEGMRESIVFGRYAPVRPFHDWREVRQREGIVCAVVHVPPMYVGPLPVRRGPVTAWPVGVVGGCWTIAGLRHAERHGVDVRAVVDGMVGVGEEHAVRPLAERFDRIENPRLRKALYTRWWSRWCSVGWSFATIDAHAPERGVRFDRLAWTHRPPWYAERRPDVSADIAQRAWTPVVDLMVQHGDDVVAAHVDAVWTRRVVAPPDGFTLKGDGPTRFWAIGTYEHAGQIAAMGLPPGIRGAERIRRWAASGHPGGTALSRSWVGNRLPNGHEDADSAPLDFHMPMTWQLPHHPTYQPLTTERPTLDDVARRYMT